MRINNRIGHLQDWVTQVWVKLTGSKFDSREQGWLSGPIGAVEVIKDKFIYDLAAQEGLEVCNNLNSSGLLESFDQLELTNEEMRLLHPRVVDFYERTSSYDFEIWSEWCGVFKPFGWLLAVLFSRRLQQLNLPLSAMDAAKGLKVRS